MLSLSDWARDLMTNAATLVVETIEKEIGQELVVSGDAVPMLMGTLQMMVAAGYAMGCLGSLNQQKPAPGKIAWDQSAIDDRMSKLNSMETCLLGEMILRPSESMLKALGEYKFVIAKNKIVADALAKVREYFGLEQCGNLFALSEMIEPKLLADIGGMAFLSSLTEVPPLPDATIN